jgi:ABC-2 type transport system permease protein
VRSICTVAQQDRKKLGVLKTDVQLFGGFSMQGPTEESPLVVELKKQYDVTEVDPSKPITDRYDVLLAMQPSSLNEASMKNFVAAVKAGQPTAIFEDPLPLSQQDVVGTAQPKRPPGGMMGMFGGGQQPPEPKGDISQLWKLLGVEMYGDEIVWQDFNPEPKLGQFLPRELVFVDEGLETHGTPHPFDPDDGISAGMRQLLFLWTGSFRPADSSKLNFAKLAITGRNSGTINYQEAISTLRTGDTNVSRATTHEPYIIAAHVKGKPRSESDLYLTEKDGKAAKDESAVKDGASTDGEPAEADAKKGDAAKAGEEDALAGKEPEKTEIDVVLVGDIDWILAPDIYRIRSEGSDEENSSAVDYKFQNIPFALNILDSLAGDDRFIDLRKRTRAHRILTKVEEATEEQRKATLDEQAKFFTEAKAQIDAAQDEFRKKMADLEKQTDLDPRMKEMIMERERIRMEGLLKVRIASSEKERNKKVKQSERELAANIRSVQDRYKLLAVLLPPILPILLAFFVYFHRRKAEQEGTDARRLRYGKAQEPVVTVVESGNKN